MGPWQLEIINAAFKKCYGLQDALKNERSKNGAVSSLAYQTGFQVGFIKEHLDNIINVPA